MALWRYEGKGPDGKSIKGSIPASSKKDARQILRVRGVRVKRLTAPSMIDIDMNEWLIEHGMMRPFGARELMEFTKKLNVMLGAGIPILQCLEIIYKQERHPVLKKAAQKIFIDVGEGATLGDAIEKQPGFGDLYSNMVRAGEAGGILDVILEKLSTHMEKNEKTKSQIKTAMIYPVIIIVVGIAVIMGMMMFVVPQFQSMLKDSGQALPWVTQVVVDCSDFTKKYFVYMILGMIGFVLALKSFLKTAAGKEFFDKYIIKVPIFGGIILKGNLSGFTRTLSTLLNAGIPVTDALDICIKTIDNLVVQNDIKLVKRAVIQGKTLAEPIMKISYFPPMVGQMVKIGEQTGELDNMLVRVSDVFEDEVANLVSNMTKMIEPVILVVLGGAVGFILIAMYMPVFMSAGTAG